MKRTIIFIRTCFDFTHTEATGFIVLLVLMLFFMVLPFLAEFIPDQVQAKSIQDKNILDSLIALVDASEEQAVQKSLRPREIVLQSKNLFVFNPNTASEKEFRTLGLGKRVIASLIRYREKGGRFYRKKDLRKIYGLSVSHYQVLEKFIDLPDTITYPKLVKVSSRKEIQNSQWSLDINEADTAALIRLKGIGSKLSSRIISYRNALGGFIDSAQFAEVYGLDSSALNELRKHFFIATAFEPSRINLNLADYETLAAHPYLGKRYAAILLNYRLHHGSLEGYDALLKVKAIPENKLAKLHPYLDY